MMTDMPNYDVSDMPNGNPPEDVPAPPEINEKPAPDGDAEETARARIAEARQTDELDTVLNELDAVVEKANEQTEAKQTINEIIEAAVGVSMEAFTRRHPTTARYLIRRLGDPLEFTIKALKEDELYQQLIANTEEALDIANVIRVIVSVAMSVAERLLIAL